jgi:hypothetical protein
MTTLLMLLVPATVVLALAVDVIVVVRWMDAWDMAMTETVREQANKVMGRP